MWILGTKNRDLLWLHLPGFVALAISGMFAEGSYAFSILVFIVVGILDSGHLWITFWRTICHQNRRVVFSFLLYLALIVTGTAFYIHLQLPYFWSAVVLLAILHVLGQFRGFIRWYQKLNDHRANAPIYFLYASIGATILLDQCTSTPFTNLFSRYDVPLIGSIAWYEEALALWWTIHIAGTLYAFRRWHRGTWFLNEAAAVIAPCLLFVLCFLYMAPSLTSALYPLLVAHSLPYIPAFFLAMKRTQGERFGTNFNLTAILFGTIVIAAIVTALVMPIAEARINTYLRSQIGIGEAFLLALYLAPLLSHFLFDIHIWKGRYFESKKIFTFFDPISEKPLQGMRPAWPRALLKPLLGRHL